MQLNIHGLIDNAKCYQMVRELRWPEGIECPWCHSTHVVKNGRDIVQTDCQHYICRDCSQAFDDLTKTVRVLPPNDTLPGIIGRFRCGCFACILWA